VHRLKQQFSTLRDSRTSYKFCLPVADHHLKLCYGKLPFENCVFVLKNKKNTDHQADVRGPMG